MNGIILELIILLIMILINGLFSMSEIAVVSARKIRLQQQADAGNAGARTALDLANHPNRFLSTVQIGITLVGIFTGAFGGATIAGKLDPVLAQAPVIGPYSGTVSVILVVILTTYFSLVLGELVPKQIGLNNPERVASQIAGPMATISRMTSPLVRLLSLSTTLILKTLRIGKRDESTVTEEEVRMLIVQGTQAGVFEPIEEEVVDQVFRLSDQSVSALITPRPEIVWLDLDSPENEVRQTILTSGRSLFPVARDSLDHVSGYVRAVDLLSQTLQAQPLDIHAVFRPAVFIPESMPAFKVLELFKEKGAEMAFVIDEYGGLSGLVTHQDVLEALIGDIREPEGEPDPDILQREDGSWLVDGMVPIDEFKDIFQVKVLPGEEQRTFQTVGGFVMNSLGRIPSVGNQLEVAHWRLEVIDMDGNRVDKVLVNPKQ